MGATTQQHRNNTNAADFASAPSETYQGGGLMERRIALVNSGWVGAAWLLGKRVRVDSNLIRASMPTAGGHVSGHGNRLVRIMEKILDQTRFRPYVTEVGPQGVEIANSFYGEGLSTLRVPLRAIVAVIEDDFHA